MSTQPSRTVALFGATGGTGLAVLRLALESGIAVNVLARTPSKLSALSAQYPDQLRVIEGDIRDVPLIKQTLTMDNKLVDVVISAVGAVFAHKGLKLIPGDFHVCEDGTRCILSALEQIEVERGIEVPTGGPQIVLLSTTGISDRGRDIPIGMIPLYHWMLTKPHADKKKMEQLVVKSERNWVLIRPSFLGNSPGKGMDNIRVSTETPAEDTGGDVAIGYTICREDVGLWIVEECVKKEAGDWQGKMVTLTH
jgi:putative NADH-flavin reductase